MTVDARVSVSRAVDRIASAYVLLWVFEGAARKWVPGSDAILYVARDALIVLAIVLIGVTAWRARRSGWWFWVLALILGSIACIQVISDLTSTTVAILGLRSYIAPLLLPYLIWRYAAFGVVDRIVRIVAVCAPIQLLLIILQVSSPANAMINLQVGGEEASFVNSGVVRASGTFSSPAGLTLFLSLAMAISLAWLLTADRPHTKMAWVGVLSTAAGSVLAGSRGAVLAITITLVTLLWFTLVGRVRGAAAKVFLLIALGAGLWVLVSSSFATVLASFFERFENASRQEDSISRILDQAFGFFTTPVAVLGDGIGAHSQAGISAGSGLQWFEIENDKWVAELGFVGLILVLVKFLLVALIVIRIAARPQGLSPILVLTASSLIPVLLWGQITQFPSAQGFVAVSLSLIMASYPRSESLEPSGPRLRERSSRA